MRFFDMHFAFFSSIFYLFSLRLKMSKLRFLHAYCFALGVPFCLIECLQMPELLQLERKIFLFAFNIFKRRTVSFHFFKLCVQFSHFLPCFKIFAVVAILALLYFKFPRNRMIMRDKFPAI